MLERVARAIAAGEGFRWDAYPHLHDNWRSNARNAIMAMRDPDERILHAADMEWSGEWSFNALPYWQAMIDAALGEAE